MGKESAMASDDLLRKARFQSKSIIPEPETRLKK